MEDQTEGQLQRTNFTHKDPTVQNKLSTGQLQASALLWARLSSSTWADAHHPSHALGTLCRAGEQEQPGCSCWARWQCWPSPRTVAGWAPFHGREKPFPGGSGGYWWIAQPSLRDTRQWNLAGCGIVSVGNGGVLTGRVIEDSTLKHETFCSWEQCCTVREMDSIT